jgi:hypothetical protein
LTTPRQGFGPDGRPRCFNREPRTEYTANKCRVFSGNCPGEVVQIVGAIPWNFSRECKSWASDPSTDPVPLAEGWKCGGCINYPSDLVDLALTRRHDRRMRGAK